MKITAHQMKVFQRSADRAWVGELCQHLRVHHGEAVASFSDEDLREEVARGIERARGYGLYAPPGSGSSSPCSSRLAPWSTTESNFTTR
jgi:hypothetical protein